MAGRKVWTQETLAVGALQDYLQDQVVMRFVNAAARDAQLPAAQRSNGMVTWLDSAVRLEVWRGSLGFQPLRLNPVSFQALSASANWASPSGGQIASSLSVDPTAIWAAGVAARCKLDGICLVDTVAGTQVDWYYNLFRGDGQLLSQDYGSVNGRRVFHASYTVDIPAGGSASFYPTLTAPGAPAGAQTIKTYGDFTSNRLIVDVTPILP